ncbi:hypothetical protein [Methylobacterium sp. J-076]|uniref:hypothetical protein n=1 Tax=Methylobacterium sp. J-076 TaxID=2836655 RepID=UPI001FBC0710|nr:hypothetical protein [Methylobacterium sp. J-076]MCJ2014088.1 hypothetical protein [Methylobacterium sp. J-076]
MLKPGDLIRYHYLWAREAAQGEESGRKARPACIVVRTPADPACLFVFPLTSQHPGPDRAFLSVPEIECRRGGLGGPSFLILDEYNRFLVTEAFDLEAPEPIGAFSGSFLRKVAASVKDLAQSRRLRAVTRR